MDLEKALAMEALYLTMMNLAVKKIVFAQLIKNMSL